MGLMDWFKRGVGEMMVARPDDAKSHVVWKHPDSTIPMKSQLTVEADELAVFFRDGKVVSTLGPGRHTLDSSNLPFLSELVDSFTGGDVFIAEVFFVSTREHTGVKFGGRIGHVEDPKSGVPVETMVHGEFSFRVIDAERLITGLVGMGRAESYQVRSWMKEQVLKVVRDRIGELCVKNKWPLLDVTSGAYTEEVEKDVLEGLTAHAESYGIRIVRLGNFVVAMDEEDADNLKRLYTDAAYLRTVGGVGNYQQFAAGKAMLGAGEGMSKGGGVGEGGAGGGGGGGGLLGGAGLGVGFGLVYRRLGPSGWTRRMVVLLVLGGLHASLLWFGDILSLYALVGLALPLTRRLTTRGLLVVAAACLLAPLVQHQLWPPTTHALGPPGSLAAFAEGGVFDIWTANAEFLKMRWVLALEEGRLFKLAGMFVLGVYAERRGVVARPREHRRWLRRVAAVGLAIGLPVEIVRASSLAGSLPEVLGTVGVPALAVAYAAGLTLWPVCVTAPAGRMSLTFYLLQSVLGIGLFYGGGLVGWGRVGPAVIVLLALAQLGLCVALGRWWLRRHDRGPVEQLWRRLAAGSGAGEGREGEPGGKFSVFRSS